MATASQVATITKLEFDDELAIEIATDAGNAAVKAGGDTMFEAAQRRVPYLTGALSDSGSVQFDQTTGEAFVTYDTEYAPILRAHAGDWEFGNGRSGSWLDDAFNDQGDIMNSMETAARSAWPRE